MSPVEVVDALLARIERLDPVLNAYTTVVAEALRADARVAEQRLGREPDAPALCGIPVSLKDNIATAGIATTAGSRILRDWVPREDAPVVAALGASGALLVGKTNMFEFAYGEAHEDFGHVRNPWDPARSTAGSSTGSAAAVAAGLCCASIATDTGGSIRVPAAMCGVVGLKPTYGAVPRGGVVSTSWTLCHVGPIGRTVDDVEAAFLSIATTRGPEAGTGVAGLRLGVAVPQPTEAVDPEVRAAVDAAFAELERQGARLVAVELPDLLVVRAVLWAIAASEASEIHHERLRTHGHEYQPVVRARLERGASIPAAAYVRAQRVRLALVDALRRTLADVDAMLLPVSPITAYELDTRSVTVDGRREEVAQAVTRYTPLASVTGRPALAVPCGFSSGGLPIGFQIVGHPGGDRMLFRIARAYEDATEWRRRPPLAATAEALRT